MTLTRAPRSTPVRAKRPCARCSKSNRRLRASAPVVAQSICSLVRPLRRARKANGLRRSPAKAGSLTSASTDPSKPPSTEAGNREISKSLAKNKQCPLSAFDPKRTSFVFLQSVLDFGPTRCWHPLGQKFEKGPSLARVRTYHGQVAVTFPNNRDKEIIPRGSDFDFGGSKPCFCAKPGQELSSRQHPERIAATRLSFPWQCRAYLLGQCSGAISAAGAGSQRRAEHRVDPHR